MELKGVTDLIISKRREIPATESLVVGISGIDASGKGLIAAKLAEHVENRGFNVAIINVDGWLNLPHVRFGHTDHERYFYENALRLDEMFERLILPLKENRSINITADFAHETATEFRPHNYIFENIDIILLEGIYLFKEPYVDHFDLKIWIECPFETAMIRAIQRAQEGLTQEATIEAYESIYFPAQRLHFRLDSPQAASDLIVHNDEKAP